MLYLPKFISTRSYNRKNFKSISFIKNVLSGTHYVLSDKMSCLWQFIVKNQDYDIVYAYAKKHGIVSILNDFLAELRDKKLLLTDIKLPDVKSNYLFFAINEKYPNFTVFEKKRKDIIAYYNLLDDITLNLNYTCNLNCKHCCNHKDMDKYEINYKDAKNIIEQAYELGISSVTLTGGEPTLNKNFLDISKYARKKYLELRILTNGQELYDNDFLFDNLVSIYPSNIQLSLYSMNPNIHDYITGKKGSYHKTIHIINKIKEKGLKVTITCFQTSYNISGYLDVKKFANSIGAEFATECKFMYNPKNNNIRAKLSENDIMNYYISIIDVNNLRNYSYNCTAAKDRFAVMPNLNVNPCNYCFYNLGNLNDTSLSQIRKTTAKEFQKKIQKENLKDCFRYDYCKFCKYCSIFTCYEDGGFQKKSEILCEDAKAYQRAVAYLNANCNVE